ncbi:MAG: hypothetical protein JXQ97_04510 [Natronospirillum sp.]
MDWLKRRLPPHQLQFAIITLVVSGLLLLGYAVGYVVGARAVPSVEQVATTDEQRQSALRDDMRRLTALIQAQVDGAEMTQEAVTLLRSELTELQRAYHELEQAHQQQAEALRRAQEQRQRLEAEH